MRMRYKPYARPELEAWPFYVNAPTLYFNQWKSAYVNSALPLRLEVGCGKGGFLSALSIKENAYNYLGIDIKSEMLLVAKRTIEKYNNNRPNIASRNVLLTAWNIEKISEILGPDDHIQRIYINFCNPWYKSGHAKHRLTHPRQLVQYRDFLSENGEIFFKTDDDLLFRDSLRYFAMSGFEITWQTLNLHADEPEWNIRTEHENMFSAQGIPIKACIARKLHVENLDILGLQRMKTV